VSLGYISEIERGQKEASSECLAAICGALDVPQSVLMAEVSGRLAHAEAELASVAALPASEPVGLAPTLTVDDVLTASRVGVSDVAA